jgi:DNA-binding transcriptional ArsR family regulator
MRNLYQPDSKDIALPDVLYALSDPVRLQIVRELAGCGETSCGGLGMPLPKSSVSYHFKVLREAGVTHTRVEGTQRFISLRRDDLEARFPGLLDAVLGATSRAPKDQPSRPI